MSCSSPLRDLLTFWLAGSLSPAEAGAVEGHVSSCAECREAALGGADLMKGLQTLHLDAAEVVAAAEGELPPPHLLVCSRCRDEVALLRSVHTDLMRDSATAVWRPSWRASLAAAAVLIIAAPVVWMSLRPTKDLTPDRPRVTGTPVLRGAPAVVELMPLTFEKSGAPVFDWTVLSAATHYRVGVFTEDGRNVWTREIKAPPFRWPDDVPRAGGTYKWQVEALAGASVVARSRLGDLTVEP